MSVPKDIIIEFIQVGNVLKVSAICARTGREVSIVGDPKSTQKQMEAVAIRKLEYVMKRDADKKERAKKGLLA